ncbi:MAG: phosphoglycerate kinase [Candidatus Woesebacteria bacterium]
MKYLSSAQIAKKRVLVRLDLDLPKAGASFDTTRLDQGIPTLQYILRHDPELITVIAHRGRPKGKSSAYSLTPIEKLLRAHFSKEENAKIVVLPNLRFDPREEKGSLTYARELAKKQDLYVVDSFATLHRNHTSITFIPQILPTYPGVQLEKELKAFAKVFNAPKRPFVILLGGSKLETKMPLIEAFENQVDVILVGGKLALEAREQNLSKGRKVIIGELTKDGKDLSPEATDQFIRFINAAGTVVWNGPMGVFEETKHSHGTKAIALAVDAARAFTLTGGGDTEAAQTKYNAEKHVDHISSGGGSMLEYLYKRTLPGIEAIDASQKAFKIK